MDAALLAVSFSAAVGLFLGSDPANRAAGIDPLKALRYEWRHECGKIREEERMKHWHGWIIVLALATAAFIAPSLLAEAPSGAGPNDPLMAPKDWLTIAPNTNLWFYFDYAPREPAVGGLGRGRGTGLSKANVAVNTNGVDGIRLAIYTPDQARDWLIDPTIEPVGRGTPYYGPYATPMYDLYWSGAFNIPGRYLIAITNSNAFPTSFRMTVTGDTVMLYPMPTAVPTPTLYVPLTVTPVPTGTLEGKLLFETATGGAIYTVNGDGSGLALVSRGIDPSWSPDGKQITFARWDNASPGVYTANADGTNERLVYGTPRVRSPRWSPDGKYIAFTQLKSADEANPIWKLGVVELATGRLIEPECSRMCQVPSWSSDSTTLAFFDPGAGLMKTSILGGPASMVMGPAGSYWDTAANFARPILGMTPLQSEEISPDGARIVYSQQAHDRWEVSTVSMSGGAPTGVTSPDLILSLFFNVVDHNVAPTWSPDGKQILFLSDRNSKWEFFVVNADGTGLKQVLKNVTDSIAISYGYSYERIVDWTQ